MSEAPARETLMRAICAYCGRPRSEHEFRKPCPAPDTEAGQQLRAVLADKLAAELCRAQSPEATL